VAVEKIHVVEHRLAGIIPVVNSFVAEGQDLTLIDAGLTGGSTHIITRKVEALDHRLEDIDLMIITHAHRDHIGGIKALKEMKLPFLVAAHDAEADEVERSTGVEVDLHLIDGQSIGGFQVVYLPGHTLGSIALIGDGTLVAGDALTGGGAEINGPNLRFTKDRDAAVASVKSLAGLNFDRILVGHGRGVETGGKAALLRLIERMD
jgi:glyoxylase-like metal-dependent hydrolase (beta-lactamase superfamily II)